MKKYVYAKSTINGHVFCVNQEDLNETLVLVEPIAPIAPIEVVEPSAPTDPIEVIAPVASKGPKTKRIKAKE